jgi:hypothetical protein
MASSDGNQNWLALQRSRFGVRPQTSQDPRCPSSDGHPASSPGVVVRPRQKRVSDAIWTRLSISSESSACSEKTNGDARVRIVVPTPLRRLSR